MRRVKTTMIAVIAGVTIAVPGAFAASPQDVARSVSAGETGLPANLANAALDNPTVQGYASPTQVVELQTAATPAGVLGASRTVHRNTAPAKTALGRVAPARSSLPFTGADLAIFAAAGL